MYVRVKHSGTKTGNKQWDLRLSSKRLRDAKVEWRRKLATTTLVPIEHAPDWSVPGGVSEIKKRGFKTNV